MSTTKLKNLSRQDRMKLMKFICSFAWADLDIGEAEREFIARLVVRLKLDEDEAVQVTQWLDVPPSADELDPNEIPRAHRQLFLEIAREMVVADGRVSPEEHETFRVFQALV